MADMMRWAGKPLQNPIIAPADQTAQVAQLNISPLTKEHKRIERKVRAEAKKLATQAKRKKAEEVPYEQAWESADKRMRAGIEKDASKMYGDGLLSMGPEAHVMNAGQLTVTKMVNDLREHDLTKMCDDAWNNLGAKKQSALIAQYRNQLKAKYPKAPANEVERVARAYARQASDQKMYDLAVQKKMPKSDLEFLAQRIAEGNSILMLTKGFARSKAGSVGTMQAEQEATQRYEKQGGFGRTVLGFAGDVVGYAADPVTLLSMGAGGLAVKGTTALAGKVLSTVFGKAVAGAYMRAGGLVVKGINALADKTLTNVFGKTVAGAYMRSGGLKLKSINTLADKMLVGMVEGGANFGTYQSAKEAIGQYQMGGHINPKTGENEGYSIEEVRKSALHGAKMGAAIGWLSPVGKTLSTRLARATKSTVGKVGIRSAEYVVTPLAEGTIFSIPEWIEGGRDKMDVWTNYVAMTFAFRGPRALKTGKAVIGDMFSYKNAQSRMERLRGFETRLRARADGGAGLTLTKDEEKELMNAGYGNLVELVKDAENTEKHNTGHIIDEQGRTVRDNTSLSKHGEGYDAVKSKLQEMIEDTTISEASRSKMYYYATGRKLPMSTVMGSSMTENHDGTFTVRSEGFNGVITSRTFKSKKQAENEVDKIDRLVELNSVEIGERYKGAEAEQRKLLDACTNVGRELQADPVMLMRAYRKAKNRNAEELSEVEHEMMERIDDALKNSTLDVETPEAIRTEIAEKHGIDVDSAISKRRIRRTAAEQKAVDEYVQRLFPEQKETENKTRTPQERHEELLMLVDESREQGYNTENSDKATVKHEMQQSRENLVKAMSEEIATLADNGDYQGILNIIDGGELSQEQHQVLNDYINAKARYDGMIERVQDNIDDAVKESDRQIDARTNEQSGMLHRAQMQDGRVVYITHGNVVMADDGKAVDPFRSDKSVIVVDAETGKTEFTSCSAIFKVEDPVSATEAKETAGATIEDAIATQEGDLIDGTLQFKQGDRYALLDDNGQKHTVQVVQADENIVQVILDGKQATEDGKPIVMPKELLQRWSDAETMSRVSQQAEQEQAPVEAETKEEAETEPKQPETEQTEEKPTAPQAEQGQPTADVATEPQAENAIAEAEQAQPTAEVEQAQSDAMPMVDDAKGKPTEEPDWGKATPQRAHEYIYNKQESELDTEEANAFVENMIAEKQNAIKKIEGKKPKIGTSIADYKRKQAEWQGNLQTAQAEMDYWNSIKQIHDEALLKAKQERKLATDKQGNQEKQGGEQDAPVEEPAETGAGTEGDTGKATDVPSAGGDGVRQAHEEVGLSDDEATAFLSKMEDAAEEMPQLELTPENWHEQFGEDGVLTTPIGKVKMGANQIAKLFEKGRSNQFGMIKPTLENPNVIIEVPSSSIDGTEERYSSYLFVKTFTGSDGRKIYYFKSVTVKKDGMEVSVSSHYDRPKRILDALKKGKLLYRFDGGAQTEHRPADVSVTTSPVVQGKQRSSTFTDANRENTTPISDLSETSSEDKGSKSSSKSKEKTEKGAETHEEKQGAQQEKFTPTPQKEGESVMGYAERVAGEHQAHVTRKKEEAKVDTNPTEAQKEAGNYRKGHIKIDGMDVTIEQPKGSVRRGTDADGKAWESKMHNTYGYIRGTQSVDGDHIDIFLSDNPESGNVYVVDQVNTDGTFDEHKVMYGFPDMESARKAYLSNYKDGWQGLGNITEVSKEEFKKWINGSKRKTKPFEEYSSVKTEGDVKVVHPIESSDGPETHQGGTEAESSAEPQPIGQGEFGPIYDQFKGKAKEAVEFLLRKKNGEAVAALHHKDIGDIDLVWGKAGTAHSDGFGLAKLSMYHPEVISNLQEILDNMVVTSRTDNRVQLESEKYHATVRLTWDNKKKTWLLTMFEKKNSTLSNTTDTDKTHKGNGNDTATPESTVISESKDKQTSATKQVNENKSTKLARLQSTGERFEGISAEQGRATAKVEETHRKRNEIKNRIKKLLGGDKREDYERADEGTKIEVDNLLAEYNGLADNISEEDLLLANRYALEMLNDDSLGVRDQGASLQNRIQVLYSLKHPHRLLLLPMTKAANDSKLARLQSTDKRFEGTQSEDAFVSKEKVRKAIDAYEDALYKFNNRRDKLWKEKKSIPSDTREREELNSTKQELQDVLLQLNTKELSDLLKQVSVKDTENVIENVLGVVYRQEQRLMAFNALLDKQGHITPEYKEDKKAISVSEFVETDKKRSKIYIMLTGVFHDKGYVVGTDAHLLLARKEDYDKSLEGKVTNKKGEVLDGKYPDWRAAVSGKQGKSWGVNLEDLHAFTRGVLSKLRAEKANPSTKKDAKIAFKTADGKIVQCYANALDKALRGAKSIGAKSFFGKDDGFAITQTPKGYVVCPMLYPFQNIDDNSFAYVPRVSGLHHSTETLSNDTEATRQPSQAEGTAQDGVAGKGSEAGEVAKPATDKQGNPLNADGSLKVEKIGAVEELTDGDFSAPTRNVQLPTIPKNIDDAIGANGKPVVIKKNIFEKNKQSHSDLTPAQSRDILQSALYNADLYGQNQKARRPYNWIVINTKDNTGNNRLVLLEVNDKKDNVEIIHWHYIREAALETIKRQAEREGGLILILPSDYSEEAGGLSSRTPDLSSDVKDSKVLDTKQENLSEDDRANLSELSDFAVNTDSAKRTAVDTAGFDSEALTVPLLVDGKPSRLSVATIVPDVITDRSYQTAVYDYSGDIDNKTNSGWQKWEDLSDEYNSKVSEEEKASVFGDSAELHFKTVDAAVKFNDWLRTGRIEKQQSADNKKGNEQERKDALSSVTRDMDIRFQIKGKSEVDAENGERHRQGGDFAPMSKEQGEALIHELEKTGLAGASVERHEDFIKGLEQRQGARFSEEKDNVLTKASDFIHNAVADVKKYAGKYFDIPLPEHVEKKVKQITKGVFNHHISANSLVHILRNHGLKGKKITENSIPLRDEDLELIPYIMIAPDNVVPGNGSIDGRTSVRFEKRLSNGVVVVVEKEYKNSPQDMETITMWAETSSNVSDARTEVRPLNSTSKPAKTSIADARTVTISSDDVAKIHKDGELAMTKAHKNRYQVVYHGSGAEFSEFDHSHMGSGEGAQAHGWGTYVAVDPNTSRYYAETLLQEKYKENRIINQLAKQRLESDGSKEESLSYLRELLEEPWSDKKRVKKQIKIIETGKFLPQGKTHFYTVDIPDNDGSNYIEEDGNVETVFQKLEAYKEHLKKDPAVRKRTKISHEYDVLIKDFMAKKVDRKTYLEKAELFDKQIDEIATGKGNDAILDRDSVGKLLELKKHITNGKEFYSSLKSLYVKEADKAASELLHRAGFTGIHYEGQRDGECYVIFNDKDLKITHHERFMRKGDGTIYGYFDEQGVAHFDESVMNGNTAIHEFGHPWQDWCKRTNPKLYERGVELINESPYMDEVRTEAQDPDSVYYGMSEEQMADEAIARAIGDKGEKMLEKHGVFKFAQLRDWLVGLWQSLKQKFGVGLNENLEDMTLDEFTTIASRDILGGEKLHDKATGNDFTHEELSIIDTAKRDKQYLEAVQRGDMETAKEATEQKDSSANDTARSHAFDKEVNEQFNRELAELTEENADTKIFNIGSPSSILLSAGVEDKPMKLYGNKVVKKMKKHGFALDELRNLPKAVADPIAVFNNYQRKGNRTILTELRSQGKNIMVAVTLGKNGVDVDFNIVSSVFGKGSSNIVDWINKGYITYVDKEKALHYLYLSAPIAEATENIGQESSNYLNFSERGISEAAENPKLSSAAKIVKEFVNPSIVEERNRDFNEELTELDKRYMEAVKRGDMATAQRMVNEAARRSGYFPGSNYQGTSAFNGSAPYGNGYFITPEERKEAFENDEFDGDTTLADYVTGGIDPMNLDFLLSENNYRHSDAARKEAIDNIREVVRAKGQRVTMYRSVPSSVREGSFRNGDWVSPSRKYAEENARVHGWGNAYRIIEQDVPISEVWFDGNDIAEWGYGSEGDFLNDKDYLYGNTLNNRKLPDAVTYDDNGDVIPLSKRFDTMNGDLRFRTDEGVDEVNERFNRELQMQIEGRLPNGHVYALGMPSDVLLSTGVPDLPIQMNASRLKAKATSFGHDFELNEIKDLVKALQTPLAVFAYGDKSKAQNIIVPFQKDGKNFIVGLSLNPTLDGRSLEINSVRNVFPKNNSEWLNWISQGKALYLDKEKVQTLIDQQRTILADVEYLNLNSIAKIVENFENPNVSDGNVLRERHGVNGDEDISLSHDPMGKLLGESVYTDAQRKAFGERERKRMAEHVSELSEKLNLKNVDVVTDASTLSGKRGRAKGFFNKKTGRITIVIPNHADMTDVERTILHEAVAHKGLRELFGEKFGTFLDNVYRNAEEHIKQTIDKFVSDKGMSRHEATEEYMAGLAEDTNFEQVKHTTWWAKVKSWFADMLHKLGFENFVTAEKIGNNELRYVLWRSYENLKSGGLHGIFAKAEDIAKQQKLKVGDYAEEAVRYRDGEETGQDGEPVKPQGEAEEENFLKDYNAGDATFEEAITEGLLSVAGKHKEDIKARVQATEAIGGQLSKLNKAMRVQKKYDKATVDHIIRLARTILTNGGLDKLTHGEVKRLLSYVNKSVGKEAITTQARQVLDLLTEHQLKVCRESLNQLLRIKGKKVNQQGVEVQAGLDVKGQRMLETARAGIALDIDTLEQRMAEAQEKMGSDLAVEAENASIDYEGLMIARHYHELIKDSKEEEASVFGDSAELHFKTVDAAVKFNDWLRTGRIEKQQSADELRNDTAAKQLATNAVLDALDNAGISVEVVSDEAASEMPGRNEVKAVSNNKEYLGTTDHVQFMRMGGKKKSTLETASPDNQDHQTVVSSADGAKILNDLDNLVKEYEISKGNKPNTFIGDVSKALGAKWQGSASEYASFETKSGKTVTIRLSNHNAKVSTFDAHHEVEGISIVVTPKENKGISNDGNAHVTEFYYNAIKLRRADGKPLVEILKSIKQALYSGAYTDNTGLAEVKEVNAPTASKGQTDSGKVYGWTVGGKIFLTKDGINPNTPIHEYTHLWAEAMRQRNAKGWQSVKDLLKQRPCLGIR